MTGDEPFEPEFRSHAGEKDEWCSICKRPSERFVDVTKPSRPSKGEGQASMLQRHEAGSTRVPGDYARICSSCVARMVRAIEEPEKE